jgi:hypothetical protein
MRLIHTIDLDHIKDTKRVIQCSKSKDRQYIGQQKIIKKPTNKSRQTNTQKTKDQATRTLLKTGRGGGVTDVFGKGKEYLFH